MNCYNEFISETHNNANEEFAFTIACSFGFCSFVYFSGQLMKKMIMHIFRLFLEDKVPEISTQEIQPSDVILNENRKERRFSQHAVVNNQISSTLWPVRVSSISESEPIIRSLANAGQPTHHSKLASLKISLHDAVATFQVCACSLENSIIRSTLGLAGLLSAIVVHNFAMSHLVYGDAYGSPCNVFYRYLESNTTLMWLLISWCLQLVGAFAALHLSYFWWSLRASSYYTLQLCTKRKVLASTIPPYPAGIDMISKAGDLHVSVPVGMAIEGGAAFFDVLLTLALVASLIAWKQRKSRINVGQNSHTTNNELPTSFLEESIVFSIRQFIGLYIIYLGLPLTGLYVNPANALIQTWGLGHSRPVNHILVYWLSPMIGIWIAFHLGSMFTSTQHRGSVFSTMPPQIIFISPALDTSTQMPESDCLRSCPSLTMANRLQMASVKNQRRTARCNSFTRPPATGTSWRRSSECRFLSGSRGLGDVCRRCPVQNNDSAPQFTPSIDTQHVEDASIS